MEESAFLNVTAKDLNSFIVGMSESVTRCLIRLKRMRWLMLGGFLMNPFGFSYFGESSSSSPASWMNFLWS